MCICALIILLVVMDHKTTVSLRKTIKQIHFFSRLVRMSADANP